MMNYKILCLFLLLSNTIFSQQFLGGRLYFESSVNLGNYYGIGGQLNFISDDNLSLELGYTGNFQNNKQDIKGFGSLLIFLGDFTYYDTLQEYHILAGKHFFLNQAETLSINFLSGLGYAKYSEPYLNQYNNDFHRWDSASFILKPKFELYPSSRYKMYVAPYLVIGNKRNLFAVQFGQSFSF